MADEAVLLDGLAHEGAGWAEPEVRELGRLAGTERAQEWGRLANEHPPVLRTHDRYGHRIDEVEFHPAWHELMNVAVTHGLHGSVREVKDSFTDTATIELRARRVAEGLALALQGSLLLRHGHPAVADAFCATRLARDWGTAYGTLPPGLDLTAIIDRATPKT